MRIIKIIVGIAIPLLVLSYFLFTPYFTLFLGWNTLPDRTTPPIEAKLLQTNNERLRKVSEFINEQYKEGEYPSLSVAIWQNGEIRLAQTVGYADLENQISASLDTQYRIGSSSKAINATIAALLVEEQQLDLDKPINAYIDYFNKDAANITTRQLLSHTAGIRHYGLCWCFPIMDYENTTYFDSVESAIDEFSDSPLLFKPGTGFSYSSYGIVLSSGVIEAAAGKPYLQLVEERLASPLGLTSLKADKQRLNGDRRAQFYDVYEGSYKTSEFIDSSIKWAGGGFVARPIDLAKLGGAWLEGNMISPATRNTFWTPQTLANGDINEQSYALGWRRSKSQFISDKDEPTWTVHHNGTARGAASNFVLFPEYKLAISVMTNRSRLQTGDTFFSLASRLGKILITSEVAQAHE